MHLRKKLRNFELLSGLFGWLWLITIPFSLWFFWSAAFGDAPWTRLFVSLAISFVAKNMVRGFEAHKMRVAMQLQLMSGGLSEGNAHELAYAAMNGGRDELNKRMQELGVTVDA